jgi:hypothetical protein
MLPDGLLRSFDFGYQLQNERERGKVSPFRQSPQNRLVSVQLKQEGVNYIHGLCVWVAIKHEGRQFQRGGGFNFK